jgi:hypothetical protein
MGYQLKYFMWSYQLHFQINAEQDARSVFRKLDARFSPRVFLVGFQETPREGSEPICVAPDDCVYQPEIRYYTDETTTFQLGDGSLAEVHDDIIAIFEKRLLVD